ncbi:MAG: POTRA domain-containing protein, partial [Saprospiraceae bacterium]
MNSNQKLLKSNNITIKDHSTDINEELKLKSELSTLYKQKPNRRWLFIFRREKIYSYLQKKNKSKVLFRKTLEKIAEPPSILNEDLILATENNIHNFMFNKGYFDVNVDHKTKVKKSTATVNYLVFSNKLYLIDSFAITADDSKIEAIVTKTYKESFLGPGKPFDNILFQLEKRRITNLLNNSGYAEFNPFYIDNLDTDTSNQINKAILHISNPDQKMNHTQYEINQVNIYKDFNSSTQPSYSLTSLNSLNFYNTQTKFYIKNKLLAKKILLRPEMLYSKARLDSTYNRLSQLEFYKFINIETKVDSSKSNKLIHNIFLTPSNKWVFDIGTDLNYTTLRSNAVTSLFGISGYTLLKNRNVFHGAEVFDSKVEVGAELSFLSGSLFNAFNFNFSNSYHLPSFYDITGSFRLSKVLLRPFKVNLKKPDARTSFNLGIELVSLIDFFKYVSFNSGISYNIPINKNSR